MCTTRLLVFVKELPSGDMIHVCASSLESPLASIHWAGGLPLADQVTASALANMPGRYATILPSMAEAATVKGDAR